MPSRKSAKAVEFGPVRFPMDQHTWIAVAKRLRLSPQQTRVVNGVLHDWQDQHIADDLGIAHSTIRSHLETIYLKTNTDGRSGLIIRIFEIAMQIVMAKK